MSKPKVLFSIPTRHHVEIALDELEGLQELGYECEGFPYAAKEGITSKAGRLKVIFQNALQLVSIAKKFKPDIIYFNSRLEALAGLRDYITIRVVKALYRKKVRFVIKSHGSDLEVLDRSGFITHSVIIPYLKKNVTGWLFLSSEEKNKVVDAGHLSPQKVFVTKNVVRVNHFKKDIQFKSKLNIPVDDKVLLYVGRLIKEKGIYDVVNAFAQIRSTAKAKLVIVGWGAEEESLKQLCVQLGINDDVIFTGFIPEKDVVDFYANSDVLVFPTYFPEGFPMSLFNSVSAGLPIITTPTRAATDYLSDPDNCLWVKPQNPDSIAVAMLTLLQSDVLAHNMSRNNLQKGKEFSKQHVCLELAETLNAIMLL
ncbi:glycosyltransferase family 4 protein [Mucilaginibacter lacusdianchii]|uniref:glycosyltransferase family 4 protein n=1 Tax=Mucilaginibacter lacusdianchii TaxID=2684211 RepID=UPI00131AB2E0|nr:glycosyltransferase family 4 protein [Mucilaginibacter sp. JXJ CY 39]